MMDQELEGRKQRAEQAGERFGAFMANALKGILMGLGIIFAAVLIFQAF